MDIHVFFISDHIAVDIAAHTHKFFQMIYCKSGEGVITLSEKRYVTEPGNIYFAAPGVLHSIENTDSLDIIELKFYAYGQMRNELEKMPDVFSIAADSLGKELLLRSVEEGFAKRKMYNSAVDAGITVFFMNLGERVLDRAGTRPARTSGYVYLDAEEEETDDMDVIIFRLRDYIEKHFDEEITLDDLVNEAHFNKTYFVKRFKDFWEIPPMKYVNNVRLRKADELLLNTDRSVMEIAKQTGFGSIHYFSRKFKEKYGVAPSEYRAQRKKKHEH